MADEGDGHWLSLVLEDRVQRCWPEAQRRVSELRSRLPTYTDDELANELIGDGAFWAGVVGVGLGGVAVIPGIGQYIAIGSVAPEMVYLTKLQFDTALGIAAVYDKDIALEMLKPMLLACLVCSLGHEFLKAVTSEAAETLSRRAIERLLRGAGLSLLKRIASQLGVAMTKKGLLRAVPLVSIPVNAAMNYGGLVLAGKVAKH